MKKTIAVIYRLAFILFSAWAILERAAFNLQDNTVKLLNFTVFTAFCNLICILFVFFATLRGRMLKALMFFKTSCAFLSLLTLGMNLNMILSHGNNEWILNVLLPFMMILDYLIFDKHARLKLWQMLIGMLGALALAALLCVLAAKVFSLPDALEFFGLFSARQELMQLLLNLGVLCIGLYLLDRLFTGELFQDMRSVFALLLRLLFLLLEIQAFARLSDMNLSVFLQSLRYYENLVNFLSFLCIVSVLIYNAIRFKVTSKGSYIFSRIKCFLTICMVFVFVVYHFYAKGAYRPNGIAFVLYYIAPLIMLLDWALFDNTCRMRGYDPLLWMLFLYVYFLGVGVLAYTGILTLYPLTAGNFAWVGILASSFLIVGYIFYFIDRFIKGR